MIQHPLTNDPARAALPSRQGQLTRGPQVVLETNGTGTGQPAGYLSAFLIASLASAYVMYGFDTASSLGEECLDPSRNAPRAIIRAIVASFLLGGLILLLALMSVSSLKGEQLSTDGLQYVVLDVLGQDAGKAMLWCVLIAVTVCALAVHTAAIRLAFAMARDNNLPASSKLAKVNPRFQTPVLPTVIIGILALAILVVNIRQPQIFTVVTSIGIIMIYIAYLMVTGPMLVVRLRGKWRPAGDGKFSLGRWGLLVNIVAVAWGTAMTINLIWPRRGLQRGRPVPLVSALGCRPLRRHRDGRRLRLLLVRAAAPDRGAGRAPAPDLGGRVRTAHLAHGRSGGRLSPDPKAREPKNQRT